MDSDLKTPKLAISDAAFQQILLIQRHDYTLAGMSFRVKIGGKGCNGFTYELGFSPKRPDDLVVRHTAQSIETRQEESIEIAFDPFTAYYAQVGSLDFVVSAEEEGFRFTNHNETLYQGKFFKDETMVPPWEKAKV